ncbi:hypothetical protein [Chitinophaga rhizosphaerae]|uniref:hypothetical protein n=1 Tax=Chitinophaga rhizosphaerae TaxID=1864947 RepID=UPI000F809E98|nr:hypothetical protein [Chitinophaga rhizosphaerae]
MKEYNSKSNIFSVKVPNNYLIEEADGTVSITDEENGVGAINLSAAVIPMTYSFDIGAELSDFISSSENKDDEESLIAQAGSDNYREKMFVINAQFFGCIVYYSKRIEPYSVHTIAS